MKQTGNNTRCQRAWGVGVGLLMVLVGTIGATAGAPPQEVVTNGDFEDPLFRNGWTGVAARFAGLNGSSTAAKVPAGSNFGTGARAADNFVAEVRFAGATAGRIFNMQLSNNNTAETGGNPLVNLRANSTGAIEVFTGSWQQIFPDGTVQSSAIGDSDFTGTQNVYLLRITGRNWGTLSANYDLELSGPNTDTIANSATGLSLFQGTSLNDSQSLPLRAISFVTENGGGPYVVDQVSVTTSNPVPTITAPFSDDFNDTEETPWLADSPSISHDGSALNLAGNTVLFPPPTGGLLNPDFETTPFDTSWEGSAALHGGIASNSTQAARVDRDGNFGQDLGLVLAPDWQVSFTFAGVLADGGNRFLQFSIDDSGTLGLGGGIRLRASSTGAIQAFNGSTFVNLLPTGSVMPSVDSDGNGSLLDAGDTLNLYQMVVTGRNFGGAGAPEFDVEVYAPTGLVGSATGRTDFETLAAIDGGYRGLTYSCQFFGGSSGGFQVIDDVIVTGTAVPAPVVRGTSVEVVNLGPNDEIDSYTVRGLFEVDSLAPPGAGAHGWGFALQGSQYFTQGGSHYAVRFGSDGSLTVDEINGDGGVTNQTAGAFSLTPGTTYELTADATLSGQGFGVEASIRDTADSPVLATAGLLDTSPLGGPHVGIQHAYSGEGSYTVRVDSVAVEEESLSIADITPGSVVVSWDSRIGREYNVESSTNLPDGGFSIVASNYPPGGADGGMVSWTNPVSLDVEAVRIASLGLPGPGAECSLFFDDFEGGAQPGWVEVRSVGGSDQWEVGIPGSGPFFANSGSNVYATVLDGNYSNNVTTSLLSPPIDLSGLSGATGAVLRFSHWFALEDFGFDFARVYVVDAATNRITGALVEENQDSGGQYLQEEVLLPASVVGQEIRIEFELAADSFPNSENSGWYIDDVCLAPADLSGNVAQHTFNDVNVGVRLQTQFGGIGFDPADPWGDTSTVVVQPDDLVAPPATAFSLTQATGMPQHVEGTFSAGRQTSRSLAPPITGVNTVWMSFLVRSPDAFAVGGVSLNRDNSGPNPPQILAAGADLVLDGTGTVTVPNALTFGQTALVLVRIDVNIAGSTDEVRVWVDPDTSGGIAGLPASPTAELLTEDWLSLGNVGDGSTITQVGIVSYHQDDPSATVGVAVDFLTISDDLDGFTDVTGN